MASSPDDRRPGRARASGASGSLPLALHRPIELVLGGVLAIIPLLAATTGAIGMPAGGVVVSMVLGAVLLTLGLAGRRESEGVSAAGHALADRVMVAALLVAGALFLLLGYVTTGAFLLLIGLAHAVLTFATRYTRDEPLGRGAEPS